MRPSRAIPAARQVCAQHRSAYECRPGRLAGADPIWRTDFLTEGCPHGTAIHEERWSYIETTNSTLPGTPIETEPYDLSRDPLQLLNVAETPANAARLAHTGARLRALRPGWPFDACWSDIDSDE